MSTMLTQYADKINGVFSFFDRMIINGFLRPLFLEYRLPVTLYQLGIQYKEYKTFFTAVTEQITDKVGSMAAESGRPVIYLPSAKIKKEELVKGILKENPVTDGLICVLKTLETCRSVKVVGTPEGKLALKGINTKCLHYYLYFQDREFGFMFVKIQTWFPFNMQVYINGREMLRHLFDRNGISFRCYDNSFTFLSDLSKAQELADRFDSRKLRSRLDVFAGSINPFTDTVQKKFGQGYYWCMSQCGYATDVMFQERSFLEDLYPSLVGHAFHDLKCTDVFTFLGRKPSPRFQGEAVSDYKERPMGCRIKFRMKSNSIKMYDKYSVLRVETTINDPREFKIFGMVRHKDGSTSMKWKPMGKSIANLYRYAEICRASNQRFLDAMTDIVPVRSTLEEVGKVCSRKKVKGKNVAGLNVWSPEMVRIMESICDGRFLIYGFRSRDVSGKMHPEVRDGKKRSARTSRTLKKLRQHGLIRKISRTRRYQVTPKGRRIMGALIETRRRTFPEAAAQIV